MSLVYKNRLEIKLGQYAVGESTALTDSALVARAQDYRRHTAARMLPLEADETQKRLPVADYHVSLKIDGEFNILVYADGEILTVNPGGTVRMGLPSMKEAAALLKRAGVKQAIFAGELYYARPDGSRPRVHDVSRVARQPASLAEIDGLHFAAFDIIELDGPNQFAGFEQTWARLTQIFGEGRHCRVVEAVWLRDAVDIHKLFRQWAEGGHEGAVVRSDAAGMFKIKPRNNIDAVVIGFTEGTDDRRGMVHDLLVALMRADGSLHVLGHVGGGFNEAERRGFLSDLKDMIVKSDYVEVNDQVAYHMVRPEWVIEISVLEFISQTTRGAPINKMVLDWNPSDGRYRIIRRLPLVAMISPQFVRRRDDKTVNPTDLRLEQVSALVEVAMVDRVARKLNLTPSHVMRREVYTKQLKGQTMVRKLLMWQTNKDREIEDFPAFVIHFTDFSPNRKTPLERDIRVSSSREQIEVLWKELVEENIVKGWVQVGCKATLQDQNVPRHS
jgi:ATP-dependent DNA ligase